MNNFSEFIWESQKSYDSTDLLASEFNSYVAKVNKLYSKPVQNVIYLTKKYNMLDRNDLELLRNSSKASIKTLYDDFSKRYDGLSYDDFESLWKLFKDIKQQYKILPQYLSTRQREAIQLGKLSMNDLTIDLKSSQGRNAATKIYSKLIYHMVNQYIGKSNLTRSDLMSSALLGFTNAMNQWSTKEDGNYTSFKTYAAFRMQQQILNDINKYNSTLSGGSSYAYKNYKDVLNVANIDGIGNNNEYHYDVVDNIFTDDIDDNFVGNEKIQWEDLYKIIENNFKRRDCDIFYRYFGLNGYKREKSKDIARSLGMSDGNIRNSVINKILMFLRKDKRSLDILQNIQKMYSESLITELVGCNSEEISETLLGDDIFILLEDLTKWSNKLNFVRAIDNSLAVMTNDDKEIIIDLLKGDFSYLDDNYKKHKKLIILFLNQMYPTENFNRKTDVTVLEYMNELQEYYQKYKL